MPNSLSGKVAFLTGASGGIGEHLALQLSRAGCDLFLTGRDETRLRELTNNINELFPGINVQFMAADLAILDDVSDLLKVVEDKYKSIDILINCAGSFDTKSLEECTYEDYQNVFNVNVRAPFIFSKHFSVLMKKNNWGRIINIGSSSSYSGFKNTSLYCASKHALLGLSRSLYEELKEHNIKTFCFSPGSVKTDMGKKVKNQDFSTFIDPKELAEYIVYTVSFDSDMISEELRINRFNIK